MLILTFVQNITSFYSQSQNSVLKSKHPILQSGSQNYYQLFI